MSEHTPGPWKVSSPATDPNVYDVESESGTKITRGYWGTSACANARLIAAAPDLLAALQGEIGPMRSDCNDRNCGACSRCRSKAAIAKAEGR